MINCKQRNMMILGIIFCFLISFLITKLVVKKKPVRLAPEIFQSKTNVSLNPKKEYHLSLWEYDWPIKVGKQDYRAYFAKALVEFQKKHPNIKVEVKWLDLLEGPELLYNALKKGQGPDVYCSAFSVPRFNFQYQVPVGCYLPKTIEADYYPNIRRNLLKEGFLTAFPRFTMPRIWLANPLLCQSLNIDPMAIQEKGWRWRDLEGLGQSWEEKPYLLVGVAAKLGFLEQLYLNSKPLKNNLQLKGNALKSLEELRGLVNLLKNLKENKKLPKDFNEKMVSYFMNNQAVFLGGVKPIFYAYVNRMLTEKNESWSPVILPTPVSANPEEELLTENSVICVYRDPQNFEEDEVFAAVRLGRFLSRYPDIRPWVEMMAIPWHYSLAEKWVREVNAKGLNGTIFSKWLENKSIETAANLAEFQEFACPMLIDYLEEKTSLEKVSEALFLEELN